MRALLRFETLQVVAFLTLNGFLAGSMSFMLNNSFCVDIHFPTRCMGLAIENLPQAQLRLGQRLGLGYLCSSFGEE